MNEIYDKFVYWTDLIKKEESKLSFVFSKIFNSLKLSLDLLKNEPKRIDQYDLLYKLTIEFNDEMEFEEKTELFLNIYSILKKSKFFELTPDNFETLERIRKTQYHIWNLFDFAYNYN